MSIRRTCGSAYGGSTNTLEPLLGHQQPAAKPALQSMVRQCELVGISRSSWYYRPCGESDLNLRLMREIDEQYLITTWYG